jgi:hypothetical protein
MVDEYRQISVDDSGDIAPTGVTNTLTPTGLTNNSFGFLEQFDGVDALPYTDGK